MQNLADVTKDIRLSTHVYISESDLGSTMLLTCPQRDDVVGEEGNGNCTANNFLYVGSNDGNLHADPHQVARHSGVLLPTVLRQV